MSYLLALVVSMLIFAFFPLALTILAVRSGSVTLVASGTLDYLKPFRLFASKFRAHTLILLSRHGTQAVVTCLRGAFFDFSGSGDIGKRYKTKSWTILPNFEAWGSLSCVCGDESPQNKRKWGISH